MNLKPRFVLALLAVMPAALAAAPAEKNCGCRCCTGLETCCCHAEQSAGGTDAKAVRHPLKGVITDVLPERSALLVKHEAIPGYMGAMTMLFKVDTATLQAAVKGQAITATLVEKDGEFWLEDVQPAKP